MPADWRSICALLLEPDDWIVLVLLRRTPFLTFTLGKETQPDDCASLISEAKCPK